MAFLECEFNYTEGGNKIELLNFPTWLHGLGLISLSFNSLLSFLVYDLFVNMYALKDVIQVVSPNMLFFLLIQGTGTYMFRIDD